MRTLGWLLPPPSTNNNSGVRPAGNQLPTQTITMETVQDRVGMLRNCDTFEQNSIVKFDKNVGYNVAILAGTSYQFINMETTLRLGMLRDISAWLIGFETFVERNVCIIYVIKLVSANPSPWNYYQ